MSRSNKIRVVHACGVGQMALISSSSISHDQGPSDHSRRILAFDDPPTNPSCQNVEDVLDRLTDSDYAGNEVDRENGGDPKGNLRDEVVTFAGALPGGSLPAERFRWR